MKECTHLSKNATSIHSCSVGKLSPGSITRTSTAINHAMAGANFLKPISPKEEGRRFFSIIKYEEVSLQLPAYPTNAV